MKRQRNDVIEVSDNDSDDSEQEEELNVSDSEEEEEQLNDSEEEEQQVELLDDDETNEQQQNENDEEDEYAQQLDDEQEEPSLSNNSSSKSSIEIPLKLNSTICLIGVCYFQVLKGSIKILGSKLSASSKSYFLNTNCNYGMIEIESTNMETFIKFYIPKKEFLFQKCYYLHLNLLIFNNLKLKSKKLKSLSIYGGKNYENFPIHLLKFNFANNFIQKQIENSTKNNNNIKKYLICGHALSGKTIFSNYLINNLLNNFPKVAYLNLNLNSPTAAPRATLSLTIHTSPQFGPFSSSSANSSSASSEPTSEEFLSVDGNFEIVHQIFHGHSSSDLQFETFLKQAQILYEIYLKKFSNLPLVVNTQSVLPSSGYQIVLELAQLLNTINGNSKNGISKNGNSKNGISKNGNLEIVILSNYKNLKLNPSPSGSIDFHTLNNNITFLSEFNRISQENCSITDLRNFETSFLLEKKQLYRSVYFSKINLQFLFYFSNCFRNLNDFTEKFDLIFSKHDRYVKSINNSKSTSKKKSKSSKGEEQLVSGTNHSKSIYEFFVELPTIKLKWNELIISLLNADSSELSRGLYYLNGSFVGVHSFTGVDPEPPSNSSNRNKMNNPYYEKLKDNITSSENPLMTIKTSQELKTELKCIGLVKKVCPYERVIYLSIPNISSSNNNTFKVHHLSVGSCVFDFNPEAASGPVDSSNSFKQTLSQPYFQSKSMTIDRGEVLKSAHKLKIQKQQQQQQYKK